ncbi:uncharacterized protein [Triticum aestivum]|uniref:uncharacterized protein isoform X3 n=1 Tax=Triticum aestivum TaxID=4565 RepID=UPI001D01EF82|nr:uncharacterized protein LOC123052255 isoform X3 [Triticum aestivum]
MLAPVLGAVGCGRGGSGLARPTLPCSFQSGPEVLEEALEVGMLTGDAGSLHPPGSLAIANMSLSTLSRAIVQVQMIHYLHKRKEVGGVIIEEGFSDFPKEKKEVRKEDGSNKSESKRVRITYR